MSTYIVQSSQLVLASLDVFLSLDVFPLHPIVNKSCDIACCANKMCHTIASMICIKIYNFN